MQSALTQSQGQMAPVDVVRAAFGAFNRRALDEGSRYLAPDVEWRVPESVLNPSVVHGFDELRGLLEAEFEAFSEVRREPLELEQDDEGRVVGTISSHVRGRASGIELEYDASYAFTVCAGRIARGEALNRSRGGTVRGRCASPS
jgi:ketosteroid isomerase-like protein